MVLPLGVGEATAHDACYESLRMMGYEEVFDRVLICAQCWKGKIKIIFLYKLL